MSKYQKAAQRIKEDARFRQQQEKLHAKYEEPEDVIIKETSNMAKFTVKTLGTILRMVATVVVMILAAVGIMSLVYGNVRYELMLVMDSIFTQLGIV